MNCDIGHIALSFITDNLKIHQRTTYCHTEYKVYNKFLLYLFQDGQKDTKRKERNRVDKYKKKRRGFHGYNPEKVITTTTQSESMHVQHGEEPDVSLGSVGKREKEFVVEDVENLNTINIIVPIAVNSNSSQGPSISCVVSRKTNRDNVSKSTMINLQAQGYKIIGSNILESMSNEVRRYTSFGGTEIAKQRKCKKQIGMCENLVLFCLSCKKGKKKGMMDINLRSVVAVTSLS